MGTNLFGIYAFSGYWISQWNVQSEKTPYKHDEHEHEHDRRHDYGYDYGNDHGDDHTATAFR